MEVLQLFDENKTTIKFKKSNLMCGNEFKGETFYVNHLDKSYIVTKDCNYISKSITLTHELGHALESYTYPTRKLIKILGSNS